MAKGKIVLIPFPFDDFSSSKIRPVLCLTEAIGSHEHIIVAFITSNINDKHLNTDLVIETDYQNYGLQAASKIQVHRLMTISKSIIKRELGTLSGEMMVRVNQNLKSLLDV